ncbi:hypothetical protein BAUCODRAFT_319208 [Baudoinia panamericana UAMH 10762]|uniref:Clock-controlled pheromone ccg-4 n=1 Tax=Baudoinia panamericana (strain UAMH 10762) TaxID=717646 RepID=M2MX61_BAUPA|nr:uncharacterized protein BAUCODRAFT_319208 [Baudoinia panamericana UAMH 10762]EMC91234.1 hypothetical protein BAUCODRAFT_319208 [Baudoinia panamericana UAMH 10762]
MKFSIVAVAAVAAQAAAVSGSTSAVFKDGVGACNVPGQKCHTVKNAARDILNAINKPTDVDDQQSYFCDIQGSAGCNQLHGSVDKLQQAAIKAYHTVAAREAEAEAEAEANPGYGWIGRCGVPGSSCNKKREADPGYGWIGRCGVPGSSCNKKRDEDAAAREHWLAQREAGGWIGRCGVPGSSCNKKREEEVEVLRREAEAGGWIGRCGVPGSSCNKARDANPGGWIGRCGVPGSSCNKKREAGGWIGRCGVPGSSCNKARDAEDDQKIQQMQDAIRAFNPEIEKAECNQDGQPCDLIKTAAQALHNNTRREAEAGGWIGRCGVPGSSCNKNKRALAFCQSGENCTGPAYAHLQSQDATADKAEKDCHGPNGACTIAARALAELEQAVDAALLDADA